MALALFRVKRTFFWLTTPVWPLARLCMGRRRFIWIEKDKDKKHIGWLKSDKSIKEFRRHLKSCGFRRHYMAYKDVDELFSMRKIDNHRYQYHLRFFKSGRITGHYEIRPEASAIKHLKEVGLEVRRDEFLKMIGEWVR